jgi:hypothetical protein
VLAGALKTVSGLALEELVPLDAVWARISASVAFGLDFLFFRIGKSSVDDAESGAVVGLLEDE